MPDYISREIRLKNRPVGMPCENDFELVEVSVPNVARGQMLVRNLYMSVDPYMRGRMYDRKSYVPPFQLNQPLEGGCVGQIIESNGGRYKAGEYVLDMMGWREYYVSDGRGMMRVEQKIAPLPAFLGTLGMPGLTAYVGLLDIGNPRPGETVFVSAASGAVGSIVCQIAKLKDCHVVGSAGTDEKVSWLLETAGIDAALNYKKADNLTAAVGQRCPQGIDVYFENVGGRHLEAALEHMNAYGRLVMCGMISQYNATKPMPGPVNLGNSISRRLTIKGFIVSDHMQRQKEFLADMEQWIAQGKIKWKETIFEGIEKAPQAFIGLFKGDNFGKMIVKIAPDSRR